MAAEEGIRVQFEAFGAQFTFEYMDGLEVKKFRVKANGGIATVTKEQWEIMKKNRHHGRVFWLASKTATAKNPHEVRMMGVKDAPAAEVPKAAEEKKK